MLNSNDGTLECVKVESSDSEFCQQQIKYLPCLISFRQSASDKVSAFFTLKLHSTPSSCYKFSLRGVDSSLRHSQAAFDETEYSYTLFRIDLAEFSNPSKIECNSDTCLLSVNILYQNQIQHTFLVSIKTQRLGYLMNSLIIPQSNPVSYIECEDCNVPINIQVESNLYYQCTQAMICEGNSLQVTIGSLVVLHQAVNDSVFKGSTISPGIITIEYFNEERELVTWYLRNFNYTNDVFGEISYTFVVDFKLRGRLKMTSYIKEFDKNRHLISEQQEEFSHLANNEIELIVLDSNHISIISEITSQTTGDSVKIQNNYVNSLLILIFSSFSMSYIFFYYCYNDCYTRNNQDKLIIK